MSSRPDRRRAAETQLAKAGLTGDFVEAVNGRNLAPEVVDSLYDDPGRLRRAGKPLTPGELGCYLSHWAVFKRILAGNIPQALVLEDDFIATPRLSAVLDALAGDDRPRYDLVKLGIGEIGRRRSFHPLKKLTDEAALVRHHNVCNCTVAYIITQAGVRRFMPYALPIRYPIDVALNRSWEHGLNVVGVRPWPVLHDVGAPSSIGEQRFERGGASHDRIPRRLERGLRKTWDSLAKRAWLSSMVDDDLPLLRRAVAEGAITRSDV